ncbi:MAG: nuclear transport factor 2 family protein [Actinomycetia bacterium]|nr:nuclear transport factor 2 family protein [Actinomycetes bacterium]
MAQSRWRILAIMVIAFTLLAAACSSSDDTTSDTDAATDTTVATTTATPTTTVAAIEETPTTTEVAPTVSDVQTATLAAYQTAWNDGDEDAFRALFAPGALLENSEYELQGGDVDRMLTYMRGRRAMGIELSIDGCAPSDETVICEAEFDGVVPIAMNFAPWRDRLIFSFEDEQITHIVTTCVICWNADTDREFLAWIQTQGVDQTLLDVLDFGYTLIETEAKGAAWLEWAAKWQEAGRP